jgi:putative phage-type endonuclease
MNNEDWSNVQNPEKAFHERRLKTVGSSDIPVIMGLSPYSTPIELWKIKTGLTKPSAQNFAQARGVEMEPIARAWFNTRMMLDFQPRVFAHKDVPAFTASVDGYCEKTNQVVEIKFSGARDHGTAKGGKVPEHYLAQCHWQYIVSGAATVYYLSYQENDSVILEVPKPSPETVDKMVKEAARFLELVRTKVQPELTEKDYMIVKSEEHIKIGTEYREKLALLEAVKLEVEEIRTRLIKSCEVLNHPKVDFGNCIVYKTTKQGSVDYGKIPNLEGVDLEQYRKPSTEYYTVKIKGK